MSRSHRVFSDEPYAYFVTWTLVDWLHLFDKNPYRQIVLDSLNYLRTEKKTQLNAFVIMSSHIHAILWPEIGINLSDITRDFKHFTSRMISKEAEKQNTTEVLKIIIKSAKCESSAGCLQISGMAGGLTSRSNLYGKICPPKKDYIHMNPVKAGLVGTADEWPYSSARAYLPGEETSPPTDLLMTG